MLHVYSCERSSSAFRRVVQMLGREVLIPHRHTQVSMTEHGHNGPLRDARHRHC